MTDGDAIALMALWEMSKRRNDMKDYQSKSIPRLIDILRADTDVSAHQFVGANAPVAVHQSVLRNSKLLEYTKVLLARGVPSDVVLELIEQVEVAAEEYENGG